MTQPLCYFQKSFLPQALMAQVRCFSNTETMSVCFQREHIAHLRQECHNSKSGIFELLVLKETFADALLTHCGQVMQICVFTLQLCKTDDANLHL